MSHTAYNKALVNHLRAAREGYRDDWLIDNGPGCETCGYGGGIEIDWDKLIKEIDAFAKTFSAPNTASPNEK